MKWTALALTLLSTIATADVNRTPIQGATVATLVKAGWTVVAYDMETMSGHVAAIYVLQRNGQVAECMTDAKNDHYCGILGK